MEPFAEVLLAGGHTNSLGRSGEVLDVVRADPSRTDELFACIGHDDAWVRMRAVDTFEKLVREEPERGAPYVGHILGTLTRSTQPSVQWHVAQLVGLLELTGAQRAAAVAWLGDRLAGTDVDWIVAAQSMATLVAFHEDGSVTTDRLERLLDVQTGHHSASVRRKASAFLAALRDS
ncbi:hypothetical protein G7075_12850 [Phycicoccus sp. HDW14]|uniref:hypothetical protein n=1 Tax=Phycicoccus sp. HDW14 TaxID=2714941 RepID=UPI0014085DE2|nr:hypothetical protein [Phycicoccus sp. HDW14]QIM21808.1 hypothetical protein G7075_12850 [Phycicoccus sp. HDW14]